MWLNNKYTKWYFEVIENAKKRNQELMYEKHHIVPKSLGGSNKKENLVKLTPREHFICHMLLVKMTKGENKVKMSYALHMLLHVENAYQKRYKVNSYLYENLKNNIRIDMIAANRKENNPFYGKKHSAKTRAELSKLRRERIEAGSSEGNFGPLSEEKRKKVSKGVSKYFAALSKEERSKKYSTSKDKFVECEHCNRTFSPSNYAQWHGDKCKKRKEV
ncbi:MAG: HNH endonuclease [Candidatus Thiodiazotropha taylori]|uniref:HNH endonuclease n=1 Tax=Candidatus Thiodiazotropha taylori TaxID=2792791 RepID=A0A9E4KAW5_9GAMM|nr:HNH endonuclease [Candidatus Thiodiazotropha taylori]MCW4255079.1 HNH endonuclease [Candidatus Thiodiazotropha taylori]